MKAEPVINNPAVGNHPEEKKDSLGLSRTIYSVGYAFKDSFIAWLAIGGTLALALTAGRRVPFVKPMAEAIIQSPKYAKEWIKKIPGYIESIPGIGKYAGQGIHYVMGIFSKHGRIIGASLGAGWGISHLMLLFSAPVGFQKAQKAVDKYDNLVEQNQQLKIENARLKGGESSIGESADRVSFTDTHKSKGASFAERSLPESASLQSGGAAR